MARAAGLHETSLRTGRAGLEEIFFVNNPTLFSGPQGRSAPGRKGCKAHSECAQKPAFFCSVNEDEFKNECLSCRDCQDPHLAIDGKCPNTPECAAEITKGKALNKSDKEAVDPEEADQDDPPEEEEDDQGEDEDEDEI